MSRARLIVKEVVIQKQGEVHFFQIRLPKNATHILGIETDVFMGSVLETDGGSAGSGLPVEVNRHPFLKWSSKTSPVIGKLKLQSMDRYSIFFETWIPFVFLNASLPDMSFGGFPKSPYSLIVKSNPKPISIPCSNTIINGLFTDEIGSRKNTDMNYRVKVFVWVQTNEPANGVVFDFQNTNKEARKKS
jgi:hypothetical protein